MNAHCVLCHTNNAHHAYHGLVDLLQQLYGTVDNQTLARELVLYYNHNTPGIAPYCTGRVTQEHIEGLH